jgi:peptidyl-prolyl cis-trans isomerase SurA
MMPRRRKPRNTLLQETTGKQPSSQLMKHCPEVGSASLAGVVAGRCAALAAVLAAGLLTASHSRVHAEVQTQAQVVALVNGEPITALDIAQRQKLTEISAHKPEPRQEALDELIDQKLKLQIAKHYVIDITDKDVESAFDGMSRRAGLTSAQFGQALSQAGISVEALKIKIRAEIGWGAIVRGKFQATLQVGEKDVVTALQARKKDDKPDVAYLYTLRQILLIAPRGVPDSLLEARRHEAEGLRTQFQSCDQGIPIAQALKDVAVRSPITRTSTDIPVQQRQILDTTVVGRLTPPEVTQLGVEMFAVCAKQETHGDGAETREVRDEIVAQRYEVQSKRYLQELRRGAMIEIR